jgi:predicted aminopeptidase
MKQRSGVMAATLRRSHLWPLLTVLLFALSGCTSVGYYWQSVSGHLQMMAAAKPVDAWLADAQTLPALKDKLALSQRLRRFAVSELHLPDNSSYTRYADLQRSAVVWNVVAAPAYSLTLKTWCFPVAGCVGSRGYFDEVQARAEGEKLRAQGLEVSVYGVPAYSTLGWMNWAGGDPLLSTFIQQPEGELARLIFHELSHQVVYASGDTVFNESFATAVERLGSQRWLASQASAQARAQYALHDSRRQAIKTLARQTRDELKLIYQVNGAALENPRALEAERMAIEKTKAMAELAQRYAVLKASWGGYAGYDGWLSRSNNASLGAQAAYDELVPGFEALFEREDGNWLRFYQAVRQLAELSSNQRHLALSADAAKKSASYSKTNSNINQASADTSKVIGLAKQN